MFQQYSSNIPVINMGPKLFPGTGSCHFNGFVSTCRSSNLPFSMVFATFWCSNCSCRMVFAPRIHLGLVYLGVSLGLVFGLV